MTKTNGHTYPLYDKPRKQEEVYDYFLARDLEKVLQDMKAEEPGTVEEEVE